MVKMGNDRSGQSGGSGEMGYGYASTGGADEGADVETRMSRLRLGREPADSMRPLRLLSLDGSYGIRPISCLIILKQLMETIHPGQHIKPCDYFDLIGGSGTGGILAIMLGRLGMSIAETVAAYRTLSTQVFHVRRQRNSLLSLISDRLPARFDAEALVESFGDLVRDAGEQRDARLVDRSESSCRVFVNAATKRAAGLQLHLLRTYRHAGEFQPDLSLTQACHAALAASELVGPCAVPAAGFSYVGGLPSWNNPTPQVLAEADHLWPGREVGGLVSLGVGVPEQSALRAVSRPLGRSIVVRAAEADRMGRQFELDNHALSRSGVYVRLSAGGHLEDFEGVGADGRAGSVQDATDRYLRTGAAIGAIYHCGARLRETESAPAAAVPHEPGREAVQGTEAPPGPELEAGPAEDQPLSLPYEEKEELVPYSAVMGEKPEQKPDKKPETSLSTEEEKWLIKHNDQLDENPDSVLPLAARAGHLGVVKALLNRGLDANARDRRGRTALHIAVEKANVALLLLLLERGADIDAQDDLYETALLKAAKGGYPSIGLKLLSIGADPNIKDSIAWTPLSWACARGDERLVKELVPRSRPREEPSDRFSPLGWARRQGRDDIIKMLEASPVGQPPRKRMPLDLISIHPCRPPVQDAFPGYHAVPIRVNGVSIDAQLCTGSQATVMSVRCATATKIDGLVDTRFLGRARGIGSAGITGRVHLYEMEISGVFYRTSFSIIDNNQFDVLIGLDLLRRYDGTVDLGDDTLTLRGGTAREGGEDGEIVNVVEMLTLGVKGKGRA